MSLVDAEPDGQQGQQANAKHNGPQGAAEFVEEAQVEAHVRRQHQQPGGVVGG